MSCVCNDPQVYQFSEPSSGSLIYSGCPARSFGRAGFGCFVQLPELRPVSAVSQPGAEYDIGPSPRSAHLGVDRVLVNSHLPGPSQMPNVETHRANPSLPFPSSQGRLLNYSGVRRGSRCRPCIQGSVIPESGPDLPTLLSMDTRDKPKDRGTEGRVSFGSERQRGDRPKT